MNENLPTHPITGLRAIGVTRRGPVWPVLGGAPDDDDDKRSAPTLTYSQARNRADECHARMEQIGEIDKPTPEEDTEFRDLGVEFDSLVEHMGRLERAAELARVRSASDYVAAPAAKRLRTEPGSARGSRGDYDRDSILEPDSVEDHRFKNPWDMSEMRTYGRDGGEVAAELRARALSAIEKMPVANDKIRAAATDIIEMFDTKDSRLARHALVTSQPAYVRAFSKLACNKGHTLTDVEQRALAQVEEFRAMSLTDAQGGYLVPFQLDPTVIITSSGVRSDIRQVCRQVVATSDVWHGVSSTNVSWSFDSEATEVSDDTTTFAQPTIPNYMARGFVPISIEASMDEQNVAQAVGTMLAGGKMDLEGTKLIVGAGSTEPTGIITSLVATGGSIVVGSATTDTFALADVFTLQGSLPARYRANASWLANNLIYNKVRQFDTARGGGFWTDLNAERPPELIGRSAVEAEAMSGVITGAAENYSLLFGDFENFVITDRLGMAVEFIPHLVGANRRPTGQRGWFAYYRVGSDVTNSNGFRLLNCT